MLFAILYHIFTDFQNISPHILRSAQNMEPGFVNDAKLHGPADRRRADFPDSAKKGRFFHMLSQLKTDYGSAIIEWIWQPRRQ